MAVTYRVVSLASYRYTQPAKWIAVIEQSRDYLINELGAQALVFETDDGLELSALLLVRPGAKRNILICHGYALCKEYMRPYVDMFPDDNILIFDFRAHGDSDGDVVSIGYHEKKDVIAAYNFLKKYQYTQHLPVVGLGMSMGAATLLYAVSEGIDVKAVIVDSTFSRLGDQICKTFKRRTGLPATIFMNIANFLFECIAHCRINAMNPADFIEKVNCPVFIVHSEDDVITTIENAQELYDKAPGQKELWKVKKSKHG